MDRPVDRFQISGRNRTYRQLTAAVRKLLCRLNFPTSGVTEIKLCRRRPALTSPNRSCNTQLP